MGGGKRFHLADTSTSPKIAEALKVPEGGFSLSSDPRGTVTIQGYAGQTVGQLGFKHGDMVFAQLLVNPVAETNGVEAGPVSNGKTGGARAHVKEDPIDEYMAKQSGAITRGRNPQFCKHGSSGMCEYCMPLQPYDAKYLEENKIKHMSFHAYLRQITDQNKTAPPTSSQFLPPLDEQDFKVKVPCPTKSHAPFPTSICTKCQPSSVTLQPQNFRMVDHIEFESGTLVEQFIRFWRATGHQRFGYLYGRFEPYSEVPLGVKAVVAAIYEPPQENGHDVLQLQLPNPQQGLVDEVAEKLGLVRLGMIFTDLVDDGTGKGTVICKRHAGSYFLSSAECILAAQNQLEHQTASKFSATGKFGSRFVTCVISGNEDGGIDVSSFQVSNIAMAMVRDDIVEASVEPSLMRVEESRNEHYVPEVFYKYKNQYGLMVQEAAKPTFPVDYLLVTVTHGFPSNPSPTFTAPTTFPIENRPGVESQDMGVLRKQLSETKLSDAISDFHLLLFLKQAHILEEPDFDLALQVAKTHDEGSAHELVSRPSWQTLSMILQEAGSGGSSGFGGGGSSSSAGGGGGSSAGLRDDALMS
ncbi:nuclear protein localization protein 4 [Borealophlyctis nickersoniae]|nr:nuclear protein localization protein 4 [Borealophlyctis nickersoniae]